MELTPENCEYATAAIKGYTKSLEEAIKAAIEDYEKRNR